jgi:tRNAHis guanylyltransferase/Thg1 C terminal domain
MVRAALAVLEDLQGVYAYTESDEISVLLPRSWDLFDRELEKTVSLSASLGSATLSLAFGEPVACDSRVILAAQDEQVVDYFRWRQADAARCALNGWCYWTLRKQGSNVSEATAALEGKASATRTSCFSRPASTSTTCPFGSGAARGCTGSSSSARDIIPSSIRRRSRPDGGSRQTVSYPWERSTHD